MRLMVGLRRFLPLCALLFVLRSLAASQAAPLSLRERRIHANDEKSSEAAAGGDNPFAPYNDAYQRDYIALTRKLVRWTGLTVIVGIVGAIVLVASIIITSERADKAVQEAASQTKTLTEQIRHSRYITISNWTLELDKLYIAYPKLMPYFEEGEPISKDAEDYHRVAAIAEFMMDAMDSMLDQYNDNWPDGGWGNWAEETFSKSPIFRYRLEEQRAWYCKHLYAKYIKWAEKVGMEVQPYEPCK